MIYFDYNATTPLDADVRRAMLPYLDEVFGNPASVHSVGRHARAILDDARERVANTLGAKPSEITFTSGATESNNLAIQGMARSLRDQGRHLITSAVEHHAVLHPCEYLADKEGFALTILPVDREGRVSPDDLRAALREDTILVSIMAANNEVGTLQPVTEIGDICRENGVLFHSDAVHCFGKTAFESIHQFNADLVSICSHKFHGPKGAGVLFTKSPLQPDPIIHGGSQEHERRGGTENLAAVIGFTEAAERFLREPVFRDEQLRPLADRIIALIDRVDGVTFQGSLPNRLCNTVAFSVDGADSIALLASLDMAGICASSGSACTSGSVTPSHVLKAMGLSDATSASLVRLSLGRESTEQEISELESALPKVVQQIWDAA
ncbi:MAG: cysteine desulfurase [Candidatus Binatia bacterium]|jgi:cysteine desulfurase